MRIVELIGMFREYIFLALVGLLAMAVLMGAGYFIVYKKLLRGKKSLAFRDMAMISFIAGYLLVVISITFLERNSFYGEVNLHFLSSYRTAWNSFDVRSWQFLIFNIIMFVPLGILLPLSHNRFHKAAYTLAAGFVFTCLIELMQLITSRGIFELDDIFNNSLGTLVGYSMIMTFITLRKNQRSRYRKVFAYFSPFLVTVLIFVVMFSYYNLKEFGNLSQAYDYKLNMKNTSITSTLDFSRSEKTVPIYKAPALNNESSMKFAIDFFENLNIDTSDIEIMDYYTEKVYWSRGSTSYSIWVNNLDSSYSYTDFSSFDDETTHINASEDEIKTKLKTFGIEIPEEAELVSHEEGQYEFTVDGIVSGDTMMDGSLQCSYYSDDTIKDIRNKLVVYKKVRDVTVISEREAYEEVTKGKFRYRMNGDKIVTIEINNISLDYTLDSKGYLQPVYVLKSIVNEEPHSIIIPALK